MLEAAPSASLARSADASEALSASAASAAPLSYAAQAPNTAASGPLRASPYRDGTIERAMPTRGEREIPTGGSGEPLASADRDRKPALARLWQTFDIEAPADQRGAVRFHGKAFDTDRQDPRMPGGNVDAAVKAFETAAMRSAGLSLVSTLVSALVSGTRRLSQGS